LYVEQLVVDLASLVLELGSISLDLMVVKHELLHRALNLAIFRQVDLRELRILVGQLVDSLDVLLLHLLGDELVVCLAGAFEQNLEHRPDVDSEDVFAFHEVLGDVLDESEEAHAVHVEGLVDAVLGFFWEAKAVQRG